MTFANPSASPVGVPIGDRAEARRPIPPPRVLVALHDGFYGASSGTGFSNRSFLAALTRLLPRGRLVVLPTHHARQDRQWTSQTHRMLDDAGARVVPIAEGRALTGSVRGCDTLCSAVAEEAVRVAAGAGPCLLVGLDVPFLGLAPYLPDGVKLLLVPRSTAALTCPQDRARVRWEGMGLRLAVARGDRIAAISVHMRGHLRLDYGVRGSAIVDLVNGLLADELGRPPAVPPLPVRARGGFLLAMGRAVPEKGFEDLLYAQQLLRDRRVRLPHLLLAATGAVPGPRHHQALLAGIIREYGLDTTLVTRFSPAVRSWLHSRALRAVVVPSREEPFGRIPLEAFAAQAGPVVATRAGGLAQTVLDGVTGFSAQPGDPDSLADAIHRAVTALPRERERLAGAGTALLRAKHDYLANIRAALRECAPWVFAGEEAR